MRGAFEGLAALALALALHLAAFVAWPARNEGASAAGAGGTALISIEAADATVAALVADWQKPPPIATAPQQPDLALPTQDGPEMALPAADLPNSADLAPLPPSHAEAEAPPPGSLSDPPARPPAPKRVESKPSPPPDRPRPKAKPAARPAPSTPARVADRDSAGSQKQSAAGNGGDAAAGASGSAKNATRAQGDAQSLLAGWGATIRARIERSKSYPRSAGTAHGTAVVQITVTADGRLAAVNLLRSAGHPDLDQAALKSVRSAGRFPPAPGALTGTEHSFTLPISFTR